MVLLSLSSSSEQSAVDVVVLTSEHVEYDPHVAVVLLHPLLHGVDRYPRRLLRREPEHAGGDAAERYAVVPYGPRRIEARAVAGRQLLPVAVREPPLHDRSDRVDHMVAREVERGRDLRQAGALLVPLPAHDVVAGQPELHSGVGVDDVVYARMAGLEASEHPAVGGVDDGAAPQGGDVAPPEVQAIPHRLEAVDVGDPLGLRLPPEVRVLDAQELRTDRLGRAHVHQRPQQPPLLRLVGRDADPGVPRALREQHADELRSPLLLIHVRYQGLPSYDGCNGVYT